MWCTQQRPPLPPRARRLYDDFAQRMFFAEAVSAPLHPAPLHRLIELRLQEIHHLIKTGYRAAAYRRQQPSSSLKL